LASDTAAKLVIAARAVIFPSVWHEPAGLVTAEAAAAGRAVIASRSGGIPEYANGLKNAVLVDINDVAALAAEIDRLAADLPLATSMGLAGIEPARTTFSLAKHIEGLDNLYEWAISVHRASAGSSA
jgi:glycosyltransferase involved in cell wall biosynthesis